MRKPIKSSPFFIDYTDAVVQKKFNDHEKFARAQHPVPIKKLYA